MARGRLQDRVVDGETQKERLVYSRYAGVPHLMRIKIMRL